MEYLKHIFHKESIENIHLEDIQQLIDNRVEESNQLDYKAVFKDNIDFENVSRTISGFLNTSGGILILGVLEKKEEKHCLPDKITWTSLTKERVENGFLSRVQPWDKNITILPIENPSNKAERIFAMVVPKSDKPPHMANNSYYVRLNFQTQPLGHEQVSAFFKQSYLQKYDLINSVYGPLYNEFAEFFFNDDIEQRDMKQFRAVLRDKTYLLMQDYDFLFHLKDLYTRIEKWNSAIDPAKYRVAKMIRRYSSEYFKLRGHSHQVEFSNVTMNLETELGKSSFWIDDAILNNKKPMDFWRDKHPYEPIGEVKFVIQYCDNSNDVKSLKVQEEKFDSFVQYVQSKISEDDLLKFVRQELEDIQNEVQEAMTEIENRTK